jgi:hypothetical protein
MKNSKYIFTLCLATERVQGVNFKSIMAYYLNNHISENGTVTRQALTHDGIAQYSTMEYYDRRTNKWQKEYCEMF